MCYKIFVLPANDFGSDFICIDTKNIHDDLYAAGKGESNISFPLYNKRKINFDKD